MGKHNDGLSLIQERGKKSSIEKLIPLVGNWCIFGGGGGGRATTANQIEGSFLFYVTYYIVIVMLLRLLLHSLLFHFLLYNNSNRGELNSGKNYARRGNIIYTFLDGIMHTLSDFNF